MNKMEHQKIVKNGFFSVCIFTVTVTRWFIQPTERLTLYHAIPTFNDPKEEGFGKHCGKGRKCW